MLKTIALIGICAGSLLSISKNLIIPGCC